MLSADLLPGLFQHPLLRHGDIVSAGVFYHIHHLVGLANDFVGALGVFRIRGEPHAATDVQIQSILSKENRLAHHLLDTLRHYQGGVFICLRQENDELVAAIAEGIVNQAQLRFDLETDFLQQLASDQMSIRVIHVLEMIEIEEDHAEFIAEARGRAL